LLLFVALGAVSAWGLSSTGVVHAAEPADDGDDELGGFGDGGEGAPAGGTPGGGETEKKDDRTYLEWAWKALGPFYTVVFLSMSFILVALLVMNLMTVRRESVCPVGLVEGFEAHLNEKQYQEAYEMAKADESFLGQVLSAGLAKLSAGYEPAIEAMQEVGEEENMKLEHRLSYMALIGTISPMVGLLGTVQGMIASFETISQQDTMPKARELADGISTALFTTLLGLGIAIPAIAIYNILRNRVARLVLEVGIVSEGLMSRFSTPGAKKSGTPG
jgi:biopolymer transport protein ExbB